MIFTLHLTKACNLACDYCYVDKQQPAEMSLETARAAVDLLLSHNDRYLGLLFFGGEPLLRGALIRQVVDYVRHQPRAVDLHLTTNGLLLDDAWLDYAAAVGLQFAISIDGTAAAHDAHRRCVGGNGSHDVVAKHASALLQRQPRASVLSVVSPDTVSGFYDSVVSLYALGARKLVPAIDYTADWQPRHFNVLAEQYERLAAWYERTTRAGEYFYFAPFDSKIDSHISGDDYAAHRCQLGQRQVSVGQDGTLYPCLEFVGDESYAIGDVWHGFDAVRRAALFEASEADQPECARCALATRCQHNCGCTNKRCTGRIDRVPPALCAHERIVIPIADRLAERLLDVPTFIAKQYR